MGHRSTQPVGKCGERVSKGFLEELACELGLEGQTGIVWQGRKPRTGRTVPGMKAPSVK